MKTNLNLLCISAALMLCTGCTKNIGSDVYTESSIDQAISTQMALVIDKREVTVQQNDKLADNQQGQLLGAGTGFLAAANPFNRQSGLLQGVVGAAVGSTVGAVAQKKFNKQKAWEYVIRLEESNELKTVVQQDADINIGDQVLMMESIDRCRIRALSKQALS